MKSSQKPWEVMKIHDFSMKFSLIGRGCNGRFAKLQLPVQPLFLAIAEETKLKIDAFTISEVRSMGLFYART